MKLALSCVQLQDTAGQFGTGVDCVPALCQHETASGFRDGEASEDEEYVAERAPQVLGAVALDLDAALG